MPSLYRPETRSSREGGGRRSKLFEVESSDDFKFLHLPSPSKAGGECQLSGSDRSGELSSLGGKTPCSQFKEVKDGQEEGGCDDQPVVPSRDPTIGPGSEPGRLKRGKASQAPPPPKQGASLRRSSQDLTKRKSGAKRHVVAPPPPPPPPRRSGVSKSVSSSAQPPINSPETATNSSSSEEPEEPPITSATARMRGLKEVVNLMYSDRLGGGGKYCGDLDQFGRPHGHGEIKYDNGKRFAGSWNNGVPNAAEFQQQNPPLAVVQYGMNVAGGASVFSGMGTLMSMGTQSRASFGYVGGSVASPHMFGAANVARAQSMYGNPFLQRSVSVPMICYQGGQGMPQHPGMNPQTSMMGQQGMATPATPMQSMPPQGR